PPFTLQPLSITCIAVLLRIVVAKQLRGAAESNWERRLHRWTVLQDRADVARDEHIALPADCEHDVVRIAPLESDLAKLLRNRIVVDKRIGNEAACSQINEVHAVESVVVCELDPRKYREDLLLFLAILLRQRSGLVIVDCRDYE